MTGPEKYLKVLVPAEIRGEWRTWAAAEWRLAQHYSRGDFCPPDQRFTVSPQAGMCRLHHEHWISWRNRWFKGRTFPGGVAGDGYLTLHRKSDEWDRARAGWDEKTREQMRLVESICLSGRSVQCGERDEEVAA